MGQVFICQGLLSIRWVETDGNVCEAMTGIPFQWITALCALILALFLEK